MSFWKRFQSYFRTSQKKVYPIGEALKLEPQSNDPFGFNQMLEVIKSGSKLHQLYNQYVEEALKAERDQSKLDLLALEAKEHSATFEIRTNDDGSSFEVLMFCEIEADPSYLYFDKKTSSKDN